MFVALTRADVLRGCIGLEILRRQIENKFDYAPVEFYELQLLFVGKPQSLARMALTKA